MASFQAKIGWKWLRNRENKNYPFVPFLPEGWKKIPRNGKKIQQIIKYQCGFIISQNRFEKAGKVRKKKLSFHFVPTRSVIENSIKIVKNWKDKGNTIMVHFKPK